MRISDERAKEWAAATNNGVRREVRDLAADLLDARKERDELYRESLRDRRELDLLRAEAQRLTSENAALLVKP